MARPSPREDFVHEQIRNLLVELSGLMESGPIPRQDGLSALGEERRALVLCKGVMAFTPIRDCNSVAGTSNIATIS